MAVRASCKVLVRHRQGRLPLLVACDAEFVHRGHVPGRQVLFGRIGDVDARIGSTYSRVAFEAVGRVLSDLGQVGICVALNTPVVAPEFVGMELVIENVLRQVHVGVTLGASCALVQRLVHVMAKTAGKVGIIWLSERESVAIVVEQDVVTISVCVN